MRKILMCLAALMVAFGGLALTSPAQAIDGDNQPTAIFLVPHQDDEVLTMGASIKEHVQGGTYHVIEVLLTDGSESAVCYNEYGGTQTRENGGLGPINRAKCTRQRDAEFKAAADQLNADYIIRADRKQDGCTNPTIAAEMTRSPCTSANTLTVSYVRGVIDDLKAQYGDDTIFKTMTYHESDHCDGCGNGTTGPGHPDHDVLGDALLDAYHAGDVADARFYVKPPLWQYWPGTHAGHDIGFFTHRSINLVLNKYGSAAPDADSDGIAGIGQMSVRTFCEQYDPRPGTNGTSTQRGTLNCQIKDDAHPNGYDYFGDGGTAVYDGDHAGYPDIADDGADSYMHKPDA